MPVGPDSYRLQIVVSKDLLARIDELAKVSGRSRSYLVSALLEMAVDDNAWLIKFMNSRFMKPVRKWLLGQEKSATRKSKTEDLEEEGGTQKELGNV